MKKLLLLLYLISAIMYYMLLHELTFNLKVFYPHAFILLLLLYLLYGYCIYVDNTEWQFIVYLLSLLTVLFYRISDSGFNFDFYLFDWLPYVFLNKTIMVNVIGNILIFIPFGAYVKNIFKGLAFIIIVELMQVGFKLGMFDVVDIFLNILGYIIGSLGVILWRKTKKAKTKTI
jgi:glycopeptide antibiotics resistance protein